MVGEVLGDLLQPKLMSKIVDDGVLGQDMDLIIRTGLLLPWIEVSAPQTVHRASSICLVLLSKQFLLKFYFRLLIRRGTLTEDSKCRAVGCQGRQPLQNA